MASLCIMAGVTELRRSSEYARRYPWTALLLEPMKVFAYPWQSSCVFYNYFTLWFSRTISVSSEHYDQYSSSFRFNHVQNLGLPRAAEVLRLTVSPLGVSAYTWGTLAGSNMGRFDLTLKLKTA